MKKSLFILVKCIIAIVAIYIAIRHVNRDELKHLTWNASWIWLLPAIIFFNASQWFSAWRLLQFYKLIDTGIAYLYNLQLYYTGMFYNLFLPGGVGGDVYKVIVLKKRGNSLAPLSKATLLDRITGLGVLLAIMILLLNIIAVPLPVLLIRICSLAIIPGFLIYWFIVRKLFPPFGQAISQAALLSIIVQSFQLLSFFCLLFFLHTPLDNFLPYAVLFFVGSVIAALPISIGGIGTRELAMATGATYLHISPTIAVSGSLLFYCITALSAVAGWMVTGKKSVEKQQM